MSTSEGQGWSDVLEIKSERLDWDGSDVYRGGVGLVDRGWIDRPKWRPKRRRSKSNKQTEPKCCQCEVAHVFLCWHGMFVKMDVTMTLTLRNFCGPCPRPSAILYTDIWHSYLCQILTGLDIKIQGRRTKCSSRWSSRHSLTTWSPQSFPLLSLYTLLHLVAASLWILKLRSGFIIFALLIKCMLWC